MAMTPLTVDELTRSLHQLGVRAGDVLMVHASLRAVGPVEQGAAGVVRALDNAVGPAGTLMMVLGARNDWDFVNNLPEHERTARLVEAEPFDCLRTPAEADVGVLAEVFRQTPGTMVSNHPEGRFAARGPLAEVFLSDVPWDDYYGPGSPLERLVHARGRVLRLGADRDTVTLMHYAEYLADVPDKKRVRRYRLVSAAGGPHVRTVDCLDDSTGIVDYPGEDYFAQILNAYLASRQVPSGLVGGARCEILEAADLVPFAARWMTEHFARV
jgi:aminoglycoside N3'-acetyltransferase